MPVQNKQSIMVGDGALAMGDGIAAAFAPPASSSQRQSRAQAAPAGAARISFDEASSEAAAARELLQRPWRHWPHAKVLPRSPPRGRRFTDLRVCFPALVGLFAQSLTPAHARAVPSDSTHTEA